MSVGHSYSTRKTCLSLCRMMLRRRGQRVDMVKGLSVAVRPLFGAHHFESPLLSISTPTPEYNINVAFNKADKTP